METQPDHRSSPLLIKDVLYKVCQFLDFSSDVLLRLSIVSREVFVLISSFEDLVIDVRNMTSKDVAKHEWLLGYLERRANSAGSHDGLVTLSILGQTLPIDVFSKVLDCCCTSTDPTRSSLRQIKLSSGKIISGRELIIPKALAMENQNILKLSQELHDRFDFINYMEELDVEQTGIVIKLARQEAEELKQAALNLYESCINFCCVATNFKQVLDQADKMLKSLQLVEYTYRAYLWLDDLESCMNDLPLSINNLAKQCLRFQSFLHLLANQVKMETLDKLQNLPCYKLLVGTVEKHIKDCNFLTKILSNTDEANLALDFLTSDTLSSGAHVSNLSIDNSVEQNVKHAAEQYGPHRPDNQEVSSDDCDSDDKIDDLGRNEKSTFEGRIDGIENAGLTIGKALSFYNRQGESLESLVSLSGQFKEMSLLD